MNTLKDTAYKLQVLSMLYFHNPMEVSEIRQSHSSQTI